MGKRKPLEILYLLLLSFEKPNIKTRAASFARVNSAYICTYVSYLLSKNLIMISKEMPDTINKSGVAYILTEKGKRLLDLLTEEKTLMVKT